ncbi:MAG: poly-gamma-glutamate biosynthesis protein PgsC [Eubacteriales bacterium]|nr:poly-gamma-glutamate biosynthesis protein PgsC [Eubacteriales bacterium]
MNYIYLSIVLGLTLSLIMDDLFGITPGGMVVPGYLALIFDQWPRLIMIYVISLLTYLIVQHLLPRFFILYGKRKFAACIFVGLLLKVVLQLIMPVFLPETSLFLQGGTVIIPGLLASTYARQGIRYTLPSSVAAAALIYGINYLVFLIY